MEMIIDKKQLWLDFGQGIFVSSLETNNMCLTLFLPVEHHNLKCHISPLKNNGFPVLANALTSAELWLQTGWTLSRFHIGCISFEESKPLSSFPVMNRVHIHQHFKKLLYSKSTKFSSLHQLCLNKVILLLLEDKSKRRMNFYHLWVEVLPSYYSDAFSTIPLLLNNFLGRDKELFSQLLRTHFFPTEQEEKINTAGVHLFSDGLKTV